MSFGGQDILIEVPPDVAAAEIIIGRMRLHWPDAYFQEVDREDFQPIDSPEVQTLGGRSREFFVYRDRGAAEVWDRDGATPENANLMLHFLVEEAPSSAGSPRHVTLVCDEKSGAIGDLASDLGRSLGGSLSIPGDEILDGSYAFIPTD